jgi:single-strand DNA-binding protein
MEKIVGNLVAEARVRNFSDNDSVINFSIAENNPYKDRKTGERKNRVRYFDCSIWVNPASTDFAKYLVKAKTVEVDGTIYADAYISDPGTDHQQARGKLMLKVFSLKFHGGGDKQIAEVVAANEAIEPVDELPF